MTKILEITATTTDEVLEREIPFLDMRSFAAERRDDAKAVYDADGSEDVVLTLHDIDGAIVLWDADWACGYVNRVTTGIGNSRILENDEVGSPEAAAAAYGS